MHSVIVTGASRGLGLGIARRLAGAGYRVIAVSRKETSQLASAMQEADPDSPGSIHFVAFDLAKIEGFADLVKNVAEGLRSHLRSCQQRRYELRWRSRPHAQFPD